jgi:prepilin-type N-terminal cleavage/methylation domain
MRRSAFTLIELLVVIAIIGLLGTIAVVSLSQTRINARNQKRKTDLVQMTKALEMYLSDNGHYPIAAVGGYHGNCTDTGGWPDIDTPTSWIPGLTPTYMARLPHDSDTNNGKNASALCLANPHSACYQYKSDATGTNYKLLAFCIPEGSLSANDLFYDPTYPTSSWAVYSPDAKNW